MAEFSRLITTTSGLELIAKIMAGESEEDVQFTKVCASSAVYTEGQLQELDSLPDIQQTSLVSRVIRINKTAVQVETAFTNAGLTAGYYMKALGLYAKDPDIGEILYAVAVETSGNCYMPAYNGFTVSGVHLQLVTTVGNAEKIDLRVNPAAVATIGDIQDLQKQISDLQITIGYIDEETKEQINTHNQDGDAHSIIRNQIITEARDLIAAHNAAPDAHPIIQDRVIAMDSRLSLLELMYNTDVSGNPWRVTFDTLTGLGVTGVWNTAQKRIEF